AMGLPVLHGVEGESAEIVRQANAGLSFEPENADELAGLLLKLSQNRRLRKELRANCLASAPAYDRVQLAQDMLARLEALAHRGKEGVGGHENTERGRRAAELHEGRAHREGA
ncbi:MAG: hypothetical protein AAF441_23915, partial [Pseudomonadota bacterium]